MKLGTGMRTELSQWKPEGPELRCRSGCTEGPDNLWVHGGKDIVPNFQVGLRGFTAVDTSREVGMGSCVCPRYGLAEK